jgi:hypothetical protein
MATLGQSTSPINYDVSQSLIVVYCDDHPWWSRSRFYFDDAQDIACAHEEQEHAGDNRHREARAARAARRVATVATPPVSETGSRV